MKTEIKQHTVKGTAFLLAILIPAIFLLASCGGGSGGNSTETDPVPEYIGSLTDYDIVCPEGASNAVKSACLKIRAAVMEASGKLLTYKEDFFREGDDNYTVGDREILVGNTNRQESAETAKGLGKFDYRIAVVGTKIAITAGSDESVGRAAEKFIEDFIVKDKMMIEKSYDYRYLFAQSGHDDLNRFYDSLSPVYRLDFSEAGNDTAFVNSTKTAAFDGDGLRTVPSLKASGMSLGNGALTSCIDGADGYTVSMMIMPAFSYFHDYRLLSVYADSYGCLLRVNYSSEKITVSVRSEHNDTEYNLTFRYKLDTVMVPFVTSYTNDGVWQLVTLCVDYKGNSVRLYINGEEILPEENVRINFRADKVKHQSKALLPDYIGGDASGGEWSFSGYIDEFLLFDRIMEKSEIGRLYDYYTNCIEVGMPTPTEDQKLIDEALEKLGDGILLKTGTTQLVYGGKTVKADTGDYSRGIIDHGGKPYLPGDLVGRLFGETDGQKAAVGGKTVDGSIIDGNAYFAADSIAEAAGMKLTGFDGGVYIMSAGNTKFSADDEEYVNRLAEFCCDGANDPRINVETTRKVVAYTGADSGVYAYSPCILKVGSTFYASYDVNCQYTVIMKSTDGGESWTQTASIGLLYWATLFEHNGDIYVIGTYNGAGSAHIGISRSSDGGFTWTEMTVERGAINYYGLTTHGAPTPVVKYKGRIYRVFESSQQEYREFLISADESADLLDPANWELHKWLTLADDPVKTDKTPKIFQGKWICEGNAVIGKDGELYVLSRCESFPVHNKGFLSKLSSDKSELEAIQSVDFPGGQTKFTARYDEKTGKYIAIVNYIPDGDIAPYQRNYNALAVSDDLVNWKIAEILLCDRTVMNGFYSMSRHAFQYTDWIFDGDDIVMVVREAQDEAKNFHDNNYVTMYRIADYAGYLK